MHQVTATLVSKANAKGDKEELQDAVSQALVVGFYVAFIGSILMIRYPDKVLSLVLKGKLLQFAIVFVSNLKECSHE